MKSVLISIQPYWVFLIIAKTMGWNIDKEKTVEVRKTFPKGENWDNVAKIYCSKDKKSFAQIPKEYQPLMEQFLGKVIGEFVCKSILPISITYSDPNSRIALREFPFTCLTDKEIMDYLGNGKEGYGWHISNLVIYDKPKELNNFYVPVKDYWETYDPSNYINGCWQKPLQKPPQSWCYVESGVQGE